MASSERGTRKLAAIMFTDIKSFSKKMSENEELAMQLLRVHDDTLKAIIEKYEGKIVKAIGDAFMVDFGSAVNAVKCAIESQEAFYAYNRGKTDLEKIEVRMGIHLGDVITDGNDIFGDGVNIASRIEAVTQPNRICISQDVYSQIKNKMQLKTFHMGSISLKNIPEPVEVYEILMDSIPEFAEPSKGAQQMPSKRTAEKTTKQEAKEAEEVEASRQKAERETQEKVQKLYEKAEKLVADGKFTDAERELGEIFKIVAFHAGAQVLQGKIEEEKEKKADDDRRKGAARRKIEQRINELQTEALSMVEQDNFTEALLKVQEIYKLEPGHSGAKELEVQIGEAQRAKEELERQRAEADVSLPTSTVSAAPSPEAPGPEELVQETEAHEPASAAPRARRSVGLRQPKKRLSATARKGIVVAVIAIVVAIFWSDIQKFITPRDTSIAVAPFEISGGVDSLRLGSALASLISDELARYKDLNVVMTGAPPEGRTDPATLARSLNVRHVLTGEIQGVVPNLVVRVALRTSDAQTPLWEKTVQSEGLSPGPILSVIAGQVLASLEPGVQAVSSPRPSVAPVAGQQYLMGVGFLGGMQRDDASTAAVLFRRVLALDSTIADAQVGLGRALLRLYKTEGERDRSYVRDAVDAALAARALDPSLPGIYEVLGASYRIAGRYAQADQNLATALEMQPGNPEVYRQRALLSIATGDVDKAQDFASRALVLDPRHPDSHEIMGHVGYFKQLYSSAMSSYDRSIALGNNPSLITSRYKIALWGAGLSPEPVAEYGNRILREDSTNYVVKYWIGRAYMLSGFWTQAKGHLESGAEFLKKLTERNPDDLSARGYLALYRARLGESASGLEDLDKALEQGGTTSSLLYRKAQFFAIQNDKKADALEWLRKAVQQEYILWEIMSPDFAFLSKDPEFLQAITIRASQN